MTKTILLLSIKKVFSDQILKGLKSWEYRKIVPTKSLDEILFYCTDEKAFTILATSLNIIVDTPQNISKNCIDVDSSPTSIIRYYGKRERVVAFKILSFSKFNGCNKSEIDSNLSINFQGPQGHKYLTSNDVLYKFIEQRVIK